MQQIAVVQGNRLIGAHPAAIIICSVCAFQGIVEDARIADGEQSMPSGNKRRIDGNVGNRVLSGPSQQLLSRQGNARQATPLLYNDFRISHDGGVAASGIQSQNGLIGFKHPDDSFVLRFVAQPISMCR